VGLERGPLSLVRITEELPERKSSGSGLENRLTTVGIRCADHATPLYPQKLALTSPTSCGRSGIFACWLKQRSFFCFLCVMIENSEALILIVWTYIILIFREFLQA
jgi:hypothetical protein